MTERPVETESVVVDGVTFNVPTGSLNRPSEAGEALFEAHQHPVNWKLEPAPYCTYSKQAAEEFAYILDWYLGGHEFEVHRGCNGNLIYTVTSKGYYHYVGC